MNTTCHPSETNATNEINDIPMPPFPHASRRPWAAEACCRFPGASPLARHRSSPLRTSPSPNQPGIARLCTRAHPTRNRPLRTSRSPTKPGIARLRTRATPHAIVPSDQAPFPTSPSPHKPISNLKFQISNPPLSLPTTAHPHSRKIQSLRILRIPHKVRLFRPNLRRRPTRTMNPP